MEDKSKRIKHFITSSESPLFIDKNILPNYIFEDISIKINANCSDSELLELLKKIQKVTDKNIDKQKISIIEIDMDNSSKEKQQRLISIIKDKTFDSYRIPDNTRIIIYSSNKESIDNELMGLLVVI